MLVQVNSLVRRKAVLPIMAFCQCSGVFPQIAQIVLLWRLVCNHASEFFINYLGVTQLKECGVAKDLP